jgi:hypothetical protein
MKAQKQIKKVKQKNETPLPASEAKPESILIPTVIQAGPPPPEFLLHEAMGEPDRRLLTEYGETIRVLRADKRFTFREIAEWLKGRGIECDHNSVYREYTKGMSFQEEKQAEFENEEDENDLS